VFFLDLPAGWGSWCHTKPEHFGIKAKRQYKNAATHVPICLADYTPDQANSNSKPQIDKAVLIPDPLQH
jgi:hypothetical protein